MNQDGADTPGNWTNFAFQPGVKYKINPTAWMAGQTSLLETDDHDASILALVLETPTQSSNLNLAPDDTAKKNAAKEDLNPKVIEKREAERVAGEEEAAEREAAEAEKAAEEAAKKATKAAKAAKPAK